MKKQIKARNWYILLLTFSLLFCFAFLPNVNSVVGKLKPKMNVHNCGKSDVLSDTSAVCITGPELSVDTFDNQLFNNVPLDGLWVIIIYFLMAIQLTTCGVIIIGSMVRREQRTLTLNDKVTLSVLWAIMGVALVIVLVRSVFVLGYI